MPLNESKLVGLKRRRRPLNYLLSALRVDVDCTIRLHRV